jgi:hypothetical protein
MFSVELRRFRDSPGLSSCGLIARCGHGGRSATPARALARRSRPNQDFSFARNARRPSSSRSRSLNSRPPRRSAIGRGRHRSLTPTACAKSRPLPANSVRQNTHRTVPAHPALGRWVGGWSGLLGTSDLLSKEAPFAASSFCPLSPHIAFWFGAACEKHPAHVRPLAAFRRRATLNRCNSRFAIRIDQGSGSMKF